MALTVAQLIEILNNVDPNYHISAFDSEGYGVLLNKEDITIDNLDECVCIIDFMSPT